jgi:crotonobetainyl-CoA:carnitine CoA-transferase CaiB-like acyl-CoA transferase
VPCGSVNYRSDLYTDPQANALNLIWDLKNQDLGSYKASGNPIRFSKTPVMPGNGSPILGQHTDAVLKGCGYDDAQIATLRSNQVVK